MLENLYKQEIGWLQITVNNALRVNEVNLDKLLQNYTAGTDPTHRLQHAFPYHLDARRGESELFDASLIPASKCYTFALWQRLRIAHV